MLLPRGYDAENEPKLNQDGLAFFTTNIAVISIFPYLLLYRFHSI